MSLFIPVTATCSKCGEQISVNLSASVNASRRPDLRAAIMDKSFQATSCPACQTTIRLPVHLTYIDVERGQWLLVEDTARQPDWAMAEAEADMLYAESFGRAAPPLQRETGLAMKPRLVFGWAALREKLIAQDASLDDVVLELLKISILRNVPSSPLADTTELRLVRADADTLTLRWMNAVNEEGIAELPLERGLYDEFAGSLEAWADLQADLQAGLFVDMKRILITPVREAAGEMAG